MTKKQQRLLIVLALFSTYFIWGSTYFAIRLGIESFPPFLMAGIRFAIAGVILYSVMRYLGSPNPTLIQWRSSAVIGILLPALGNGTVCYVQQTISSSLAALSIATVPIWMAGFSSLWGHHPSKQEWLGIAIGFVGIVLLNLSGSLSGDMKSAFLLMFAAATWAYGSVWSKHLPMPQGLMASATQMLCGGAVLLIFSAAQHEVWPDHISTRSWLSLLFLVLLGSIVAYSAYQYLLQTVRPLVASSNTFVNPIVAFVLGIGLANEQVTRMEFTALAVILAGVFLVLSYNEQEVEKSV